MSRMAQDGGTLGVYVSVPFCRAKCSFCNFASGVYGAGRLQRYVDRLCREIHSKRAESIGATLPGSVDSIYFGGGTPSLLEAGQVRAIFAALRGEFTVAGDAEITVECAPGQLAEETLRALLREGLNRVSFGVQSFVDVETAAVGRTHTAADCMAEIRRMRAAGIGNVGVDLIVGLPQQTSESFQWSVAAAVESGVEHASVYLLEVDEDSRLGREVLRGGRRYGAAGLPPEDETAGWYDEACETLARGGLEQYEISNFAREGFLSRHNVKYWRREAYLGFGLDAHSMLRGPAGAVRFANTSEMEAYLGLGPEPGPGEIFQRMACVDEGTEPRWVKDDEAFEEAMFLGLRLNVGVSLSELRGEFGEMRVESALAAMEEVEAAGLLERRGDRVRLTGRGRLASNEVFSRLLAVAV